MELILIFLGASYGATNIITGSKLLAPMREHLLSSPNRYVATIGELVSCSMCAGFWVGVFWYAVIAEPTWHHKYDFEWLAFGSMASGFCWIVYVIMQWFGESKL